MTGRTISGLYGVDHQQLVEVDGTLMHREVVEPWRQLQRAAQLEGFELAVASGYRDYARQWRIWSAKAVGERTLLDDHGEPLPDTVFDDPWRTALAILRWSALPGASRHHWGCDFDVYDRAAVEPNYQVQLTPQEVNAGGCFAPLHEWLDHYLAESDFFRPYPVDRGGVAVERWHLSYAPVAAEYEAQFEWEALLARLMKDELPLIDEITAHADEVRERFVRVPAALYPERFRAQLEVGQRD